MNFSSDGPIFHYCLLPYCLPPLLHRYWLWLGQIEWLQRQRRWLLSSQRSVLRCCPPNEVIQSSLPDKPLDFILKLWAVFNIVTVVMMVEAIFIWVAVAL